MTTYDEIANAAGLSPQTAQRFVRYMRTRWADEEATHCHPHVGYAREWAERFRYGMEYTASDDLGQRVLRQMDMTPQR
jgi:hypothetical protein